MRVDIGKLTLRLSGVDAAQGRGIARAVAASLAAAAAGAQPGNVPSLRLTLRNAQPSALGVQIAERINARGGGEGR